MKAASVIVYWPQADIPYTSDRLGMRESALSLDDEVASACKLEKTKRDGVMTSTRTIATAECKRSSSIEK